MSGPSRPLEERISLLATELQDRILAHLLLPNRGTVRIDRTYQPPLGLRLSRKTRHDFAKTFYSHNAFEFYSDNGFDPLLEGQDGQTSEECQDLISRWLRPIPASHCAHLQNIRFDFQLSESPTEVTQTPPDEFAHRLSFVAIFSTTLALKLEICHNIPHQCALNIKTSYLDPDTKHIMWFVAADVSEVLSEDELGRLVFVTFALSMESADTPEHFDWDPSEKASQWTRRNS